MKPSLRSLVDHLVSNRELRPDQQVFRFLDNGDADGPANCWTHGELYDKAAAVAQYIEDEGLVGERILLLYLPCVDYVAGFVGCLAAGAVAVPAYPPDPMRMSRTVPRLQAIADDAQVAAMFTTAPLKMMLPMLAEHAPKLASMKCVATDELDLTRGHAWTPTPVDGDALAFLQYTSGSTGSPKGVMITQRNIIEQIRIGCERTEGNAESHIVNWLPQYHDLGLVTGFLIPIYLGAQSTVMSPVDFLKKPIRWMDAISKFGGTHAGGPDFAFGLCARKATPEDLERLDLSTWECAFNAAEPLRASTIDLFNGTFAPTGFRPEAIMPGYGLAEATMGVTWAPMRTEPTRVTVDPDALADGRVVRADEGVTLFGHGPAGDFDVAIVNPQSLERVGPDAIGEIWVRGPSVGLGYYGRPEQTEATFGARIAGTGEGPYMRSGDLGTVLNGELYITGRISDLIILRGKNYYPQDIEYSAELSHSAVRPGCGAAFSLDVDDEERLFVAFETKPGVDPDEVVTAIRERIVADHDIAPYSILLLAPRSAPKTSSGKIQRRRLARQYEAGELDVVHVWTRPASAAPRVTAANLRAWLVDKVTALSGVRPDEHATFASFGIDSAEGVRLVAELEREAGRTLSPSVIYDHPTIDALVRHLGANGHAPAAAVEAKNEPIAIVGIGCRMPSADGADAFWRLLEDGVDAVREVPKDRFDADAIYDPDATAAGRLSTKWGAFLDDVDRFDAAYFGVAPREAETIDPQQRLLLEVTVDALEDAGIPPSSLAETHTGTFVGISSAEYGMFQFSDPERIGPHTGTGSAMSIAANRIAYAFDLRGPSFAVDTACSSSLAAVHLAVQSLRNGESTLAIAGGVSLILTPAITMSFSRASAMAADGRCKTFDARADGYVRSEGVGVVVLKPLSRAKADGDRIHAVIRGSAVAQDGRTNGLMAPSRRAQERALRAACADAAVRPEDVTYVEAHGTGTALGDVIEAEAISAAMRPKGGDVCLVGSVKSNLGHLEAAAGVAGLIKTALALEHGSLPASLHFDTPNPKIDFDALSLRVVAERTSWPEARPRIAGVSSFGFGGTNVHAVLEAAPAPEVSDRAGPYVLPVSAKSPEALAARVERLQGELTKRSDVAALCDTAAVRRDHLPYRAAFYGADRDALLGDLATFRPSAPAMSPPPVVFVFAGQGGQWATMGKRLLETSPVFAETIASVAEVFGPEVEWSIEAVLRGEIELDAIDVVQPAIFAVEVGVASVLRAWGVHPAQVIGHSMGEVAAAYVAGALSLADAAAVICRRSKLMKTLSGQGAMLFAELTREEASEHAAAHDAVSLATSNGPRASVLAGDRDALEEIRTKLDDAEIYTRWVDVDVASHSPMVDPLTTPLTEALAGLRPRVPALPFWSTVKNASIEDAALDAKYWVDNLRQPVLFHDAVLAAPEGAVFVEIGPHPTLLPSVGTTRDAPAIATLRRNEDDELALARATAELYAAGVDFDWEARGARTDVVAPLPRYPWQRERFWSPSATGTIVRGATGATLQHAWLHTEVVVAGTAQRVFEGTLDRQRHRWLEDHRVGGRVVVPGTALIEAVSFASDRAILEIDFELPIEADDAVRIQLAIDGDQFEVFADQDGWVRHASGRLGGVEVPAAPTIATTKEVEPSVYRERLAQAGITYGDAFLCVSDLKIGVGSTATITAPSIDEAGVCTATLDALLQLAAVTNKLGVLARAKDVVVLRRPERGAKYEARAGAEGAWLVDGDEVIAFVRRVVARPLERGVVGYTVEWRRTETSGSAHRRVLVLGDAAPFTAHGHAARATSLDDLSAALREGADAIVAFVPEDRERRDADFALDVVHTIAKAGLRDAPRLFVVTEGAAHVPAHKRPIALHHAATVGFVQTLANEHPELAPVWFDRDPDRRGPSLESLARLVGSDSKESRVAFRDDALFAARLAPTRHLEGPPVVAPNAEFRLECSEPGIDRLAYAKHTPRVDRGEVLVRVKAAGVAFSDVMKALGIYPGDGADVLGGECAGTVEAIGPGVTNVAVGDEVVAVGPHALGSSMVTKAALVAKKPARLPWPDAAALPSSLVTATYALEELARLRQGEWLLITSAGGGLGLAAIDVARRIGVRVIATAGSEERRALLRERGVEHVFASRSESLDGVRALTKRGVDVVLSAEVGEERQRLLGLLAPRGRYIDLSKRDAYAGGKLPLGSLRSNNAYHLVDVAQLLVSEPDFVGELLSRTIVDAEPIPYLSYPARDTRDAFHRIARAQHYGRVVIDMAEPPPLRAGAHIVPGATYLVTGGTGGLGTTLATWLRSKGAGRVVLASRTGTSALEGVVTRKVDVADPHAVEALVAELDDLRGVFHLAGVLDDGVVLEQTHQRFADVLAPKVAGAENVHRATRGHALDFFVMFGSAAALLGSPGQSNYAAANAFLDALAHHRRSLGLPATTIDWGPWSEVGRVAGATHQSRFTALGFTPLAPADGIERLERVLAGAAPQIALMDFDAAQWAASYPSAAGTPFFSEIATAEATASGDVARSIAAAPAANRLETIERYLTEQTASVLRVDPTRILPNIPLQQLGLDSLMTIELRNRLEHDLGVRLSATVVWRHPTTAALSAHLLEAMDLGEATEAPKSELTEEDGAAMLAVLEALDT